jgi:hypothetical protein
LTAVAAAWRPGVSRSEMNIAGLSRLLGIAALSISVSGCLWAPDLDRIRKDIEKQIPGAAFDREIALSLGPVALTLARCALSFAPDAREAEAYVRDIRSVGLAVYTARNLPADFDARLPKALENLVAREGWEIAVKTSEDGNAVWVLFKEDGGSVGGVYVVALGDEELVLVRAQGNLEEILKRAIRENAGPGKLARGLYAGLDDA